MLNFKDKEITIARSELMQILKKCFDKGIAACTVEMDCLFDQPYPKKVVDRELFKEVIQKEEIKKFFS